MKPINDNKIMTKALTRDELHEQLVSLVNVEPCS